METKPLNRSAETVLWAMHLPKEDQNKVRDCIHKYAMPETFCEKIKWVFHRAVNALKHICGKSDWQVSERIIRDRAWKMISPWFDSPLNPLPQKLKTQLEDKITGVVNATAAALLSSCLTAQEKNTDVDEAFKKRLNEIDLTHVFKEIKTGLGLQMQGI